MFKYIFILISFILSTSTSLDNYTNQLLLESEANTIDNTVSTQIDDVALEETINPDIYTVGPGDTFLFNMISSDGMLTANITISPLGTVLIPNVGDINVDKLTITEAFNTIKSRCLKTYSNAQINLTLYSIRKFKVHVTGSVYKRGNIVVTAVTRVSDIYELVKNPQEIKNTNNSESLKTTSHGSFVSGVFENSDILDRVVKEIHETEKSDAVNTTSHGSFVSGVFEN